jgi:anti-sigma regulatory factor (Ser/Thr protein kinase)
MQYESKGIAIETFLDDNVPPLIIGDPFRLEHVLANLLSNAIKFSDPKSTIEIHISFETKEKDHVTFTVKDRGFGMTPDEQKLLFHPFKQIRPGELQKGRGSGLGLAICKMMIDLHHGTIGCVSKKREAGATPEKDDYGSEFFFNIIYNEKDVEVMKEQFKKDETTPSSDNLTPEEERLQFSRQSTPQEEGKDGQQPSPSRPKSTSLHQSPLSTSPHNHGPLQQRHLLITPGNSPLDLRSLSFSHDDDSKTTRAHSLSGSFDDPSHPPQSQPPSMSHPPKKESKKVEIGNILICDGSYLSLSLFLSLFCELLKFFISFFHLDVLSNRKMLDMVLKRKGYQADLSVDGSECVEIIKEKGKDYYDMIFMDNMMPIMVNNYRCYCFVNFINFCLFLSLKIERTGSYSTTPIDGLQSFSHRSDWQCPGQ